MKVLIKSTRIDSGMYVRNKVSNKSEGPRVILQLLGTTFILPNFSIEIWMGNTFSFFCSMLLWNLLLLVQPGMEAWTVTIRKFAEHGFKKYKRMNTIGKVTMVIIISTDQITSHSKAVSTHPICLTIWTLFWTKYCPLWVKHFPKLFAQ